MRERRRDRWNPDSVLLLALMAVTGFGSLLAGVEPESVTTLVPRWMAVAWGLTLATGAALTLLGVLWRTETTGLLLEVAGRIALAPTTLAYVVALVAVGAATRGTLLIGILVGIVTASVWRLWQIRRTFKQAHRDLANLRREGQ